MGKIMDALNVILPGFIKSNAQIEAKIIDATEAFAASEAIERQRTLDLINSALANQKITTVEYYRRKAVAFQKGDILIYDSINQGGYYDPVDPESQIIKQAYITGTYPNFTLLVNAVDSNGHLRKLDADELASFKTYFEAFQPIGMEINITSLSVAQVTDPGLSIYVRSGTDAGAAASAIQANLTAHESVLRTSNAVTLTEIEDVIQQYSQVVAVGFGNIQATEQALDGSTRTVTPVNGVFDLTNGAFTFATPITTSMIKVLQ